MRDGWYGARQGHRRQRWRCLPEDGSKFHKFVEVLPRLANSKDKAHYCPDCETRLETWEGHPAPRMYGFTARDLATALAAVAGGATYRNAAARARTRAGRALDTSVRTRIKPGRAKPVPVEEANRHPQLVSDWVQTYAAPLWQHYLDKVLKAGVSGTVMLDATRLVTTRRGQRGGVTAFYVLAVMAYTSDGKPFVLAARAVPKEDTAAWVQLLGALPFTPTRVVADRGGAGDKAAGQMLPDAVRYACEWHMRKNLTDQLPAGLPLDHVVRQYVDDAMADLDRWQSLGASLRAEQGADRRWTNAVTTYDRLDIIVPGQMAARPAGGPNGTGPVEHFLSVLRRQLAGRVGSMTNKSRADALLLLLAAGHNGWVDEQRWAYLLRGWLVKQNGVAPAQRSRALIDREGSPSLRLTTRAPRPQTQGQKGIDKPRLKVPDKAAQPIGETAPVPVLEDDPWLLPKPA